MPTSRTYARCRNCGRHRDEGASLSKRGLCPDCGRLHLSDALDNLHYHRGPVFAAWRRGMVASVGGVLVDDLPPSA